MLTQMDSKNLIDSITEMCIRDSINGLPDEIVQNIQMKAASNEEIIRQITVEYTPTDITGTSHMLTTSERVERGRGLD